MVLLTYCWWEFFKRYSLENNLPKLQWTYLAIALLGIYLRKTKTCVLTKKALLCAIFIALGHCYGIDSQKPGHPDVLGSD